jgi:flagellar biosynthesis protein FliQ
MTESDAMELVQEGLRTAALGCGPAVGAAMLVGILIALFQALTQIQEATLTFIPKIVVVFLVLSFSAGLIGASIGRFSDMTYARIETGFP